MYVNVLEEMGMRVTFSPGPLSLGHGGHKAGTDLRTNSGSQLSLNRRSSRRELSRIPQFFPVVSDSSDDRGLLKEAQCSF